MIRITFTERDNILSLRLEGHAEYAEVGKDIVCASASILAYTVAQFVMEAEHRGNLVTPAQICLNPGNATVACEPIKEAFPTLQSVYAFAEMGYSLLAHNYPAHITLFTDVEAKEAFT